MHDVTEPSITTRPGQAVEIAVPHPGSSGYRWQLEFPPDRARLLEHRETPGTTGVGAVGTESFVVTLLTEHAAELRFVLARPWSGETAREHRVVLHAQPADASAPG